MVLLERIELSTSPLPRVCSTTELQQDLEAALSRRKARALAVGRSCQALAGAAGAADGDERDQATREERLAAKLRENLGAARPRRARSARQADGLSKEPERRLTRGAPEPKERLRAHA